ncbi:MAG: class I SAM-dependent methyltransferase [Chloroflexota bacterium]|nr:MAG: class I SAM-dependent methyltransferase [Chloroflexota bacterium]
MEFANIYEDAQRAESYAKLEFPGTYYLAYRDLPVIIREYAKGKKALDFGCGTGRSTRFLNRLGFDTIGVDIAEDMLKLARERDPEGDYRLVTNSSLSNFKDGTHDLVLSVFTFDNIPTKEQKVVILREFGRLLSSEGHIVNLVSSPDIYIHEWASFTTKDFPQNRKAKSGDKVQIIMTDVEDRRPVEDIVWSDDSYREVYKAAGLEVVKTYKPLGKDDEPFQWVNETRISPWVIYVLKNTVK